MTLRCDAVTFAKRKQNGKVVLSLVVVVLWIFCLGSAMGVVYSTYESRKSTQRLEVLRREASGLKVVSGQFLLEKSSWSAYSRIEKVAQADLKMVVPESKETILVYKK